VKRAVGQGLGEPTVPAAVPLPDQLRLLGDPVGAQGLPIPLQPAGGRADPGQAGDDADPPMPQANEVANRLARTAHVVQDHTVTGQVWQGAVETDERKPDLNEVVEVAVMDAGRRHQNAVHSLLAEKLEVAELTLRVLVGVAEDNGVAGLTGHILDAAHEGGEVGVGDVADQEADRLTVIPLETAGD